MLPGMAKRKKERKKKDISLRMGLVGFLENLMGTSGLNVHGE